MSESKTLYLDVVPATQESLSTAVDRLEVAGLAAVAAVRHLVEPYVAAVRATGRYLRLDHGQLADGTVGFASRYAEQRRAFLVELGDVVAGKNVGRSGKHRSTSAAA